MALPTPPAPRWESALRLPALLLVAFSCLTSQIRADLCPTGAPPPATPRRPIEKLPEGALGSLGEAERAHALALLNATPCLCGCRHTLASCRVDEADCERSRALASDVARLISEGRSDPEVQAFLRAQPILPRPPPRAGPGAPPPGARTPAAPTQGAATPPSPRGPVVGERLYDIPAGQAPARGLDSAPVTIVEFSDFRCPFCARSQPLLDQVLQLYPGQVRLLFKHYPLPSHAPLAQEAALAALAAQNQGAFWRLHDRLFSSSAPLERAALLELARELGLDAERFRSDLDDAALRARLEEDLAHGRAAEITGTPMFYVNGRKLLRVSLSGFQQAIEEALAAAPSGAGVP